MQRRSLLAVLLLSAVALAGCSDSGSADRDGDTVPDALETGGWDIIVETMSERKSVRVHSDPEVRDTDGDGLFDGEEHVAGTDPGSVDTDGDGLTDCQELRHTVKSECEDLEFAEDDGGTGTDPRKADSDPGPSRYKAALPFMDLTGTLGEYDVLWGDGLSDGAELAGFDIVRPDGAIVHVRSDPRSVDSDGDGLEDAEEVLSFNSNPGVEDTDGDTCADGRDPWPDRIERYGVSLGNLTLLTAMDDGGGADVAFDVVFGDTILRFPEAGTYSLLKGETVDLSEEIPDLFRLRRCDVTPHEPWIKVQVVAYHQDGETIVPVDLFSKTAEEVGVPAEPARLWWNVRTGVLAGTAGGSPISGADRWDGANATLEIAPRLGPQVQAS